MAAAEGGRDRYTCSTRGVLERVSTKECHWGHRIVLMLVIYVDCIDLAAHRGQNALAVGGRDILLPWMSARAQGEAGVLPRIPAFNCACFSRCSYPRRESLKVFSVLIILTTTARSRPSEWLPHQTISHGTCSPRMPSRHWLRTNTTTAWPAESPVRFLFCT